VSSHSGRTDRVWCVARSHGSVRFQGSEADKDHYDLAQLVAVEGKAECRVWAVTGCFLQPAHQLAISVSILYLSLL
jgi:hypothetical protein